MKLPSSLKSIHPAATALILAILVAGFILVLNSTGFGIFRAQLIGGAQPCNDQADNDGDGKADYPGDLGCLRANDANENQDGECFDNVDNDGDGAIDSVDFSCRILFNGESMPKPFCQDGIDNDKDSKIDLQDPGCRNAQDHSENG